MPPTLGCIRVLYMGTGDQSWIFLLVWQALYQQSHLPSLQILPTSKSLLCASYGTKHAPTVHTLSNVVLQQSCGKDITGPHFTSETNAHEVKRLAESHAAKVMRAP